MTTIFNGAGNLGLQIGHNPGSIEAHFHAERPETSPQPSCFVPFPRDTDFVDRGTLLEQICQRCSTPASRIALVGLGGVGKSQLAIEYCYRAVEQSPDTWVFWANAGDTAQLEQSLCEIANQVKIRGRKDPQANVLKLVHDWLRDVKNGRWLLVLDNADDVAVLSPTNGSSALQYLPPSSHGSVLVMSRTKRAAMQIVEDNQIISIEPMDDESASALLRKKLRNTSEENDDSSIAQLATVLDRMPLALIQAAAYIRERAPRCSVRQYLEAYQQSDSRRISLLNREAGHLRRDKAASNSILVTWQISFDHIQKTRPSAADLLSLMSFFDRHRIQETLLRPRSNTASKCASVIGIDDDFEDDVLTLRDYTFITATKDANTFEMHDLVQLATRAWLENQGQLDRWRDQFISNLCAELPRSYDEEWEKCMALLPHARVALTQRPKDSTSLEWAQLLFNAAEFACNYGILGEAELMSVASMDVRRDVLGEKHECTLKSMVLVGAVKSHMGNHNEAEAILRQALALCKEIHGDKSPETLMSTTTLVVVLIHQGKYQEAEVLQIQALTLSMELYECQHEDTLMCMNTSGTTLLCQGKYEEAEKIYRQTLEKFEEKLGHEHVHTLTSITYLVWVLNLQAKYEEAEPMSRQVLMWSKKTLGHEHPQTLARMSYLATALLKQGKCQEAEALLRQTLVIREKVLGHEHVDTLHSVYCLAVCLKIQQRYDEALPLIKRACVGSRNVSGKDHPRTLEYLEEHTKVLSMYQANQRVYASSSKAGNTGSS